MQIVLIKGFDEEFVVEMRQRLMETSYQINAAAQGKHKGSLLEILNIKVEIRDGRCYLNRASFSE